MHGFQTTQARVIFGGDNMFDGNGIVLNEDVIN
jgi:hypothetical protein